MPAPVKLNKNGWFFVCLISLVLLILWTSRTDLPPKKEGLSGSKSEGGLDFGGLGGGHSSSDTPDESAEEERPRILQPPVPPPRPAWMDAPNQAHYDISPERVEAERRAQVEAEQQQLQQQHDEQEAQQQAEQQAQQQAQQQAEHQAQEQEQAQAQQQQLSAPQQDQQYGQQNAFSSSTSSSEHSAATQGTAHPNPEYDLHKLKRYKPHNYIGPGHATYATYLSTRGGSLEDPYFLAAQQLVYRILWDPRSKSVNHPITVFVAPHIPDQQRDILSAAGALVRELDYVDGHTAQSDATKWKDLFSKLNMWAQTDFTRITFLDIDAFPVKNIDGIFDVAEKRQCQRELLPTEEQGNAQQICEFVFTGTDASGSKEVNAGMMVFDPNAAMHQYLLRESQKTDNFDSSMAEQPFLNFAFRQNGPFPTQFVDRTWNGIRPQEHEKDTLKVMHAKLWEVDPEAHGALSWAGSMFSDNWSDMLALYQSPQFEGMRAADGTRAYRR